MQLARVTWEPAAQGLTRTVRGGEQEPRLTRGSPARGRIARNWGAGVPLKTAAGADVLRLQLTEVARELAALGFVGTARG